MTRRLMMWHAGTWRPTRLKCERLALVAIIWYDGWRLTPSVKVGQVPYSSDPEGYYTVDAKIFGTWVQKTHFGTCTRRGRAEVSVTLTNTGAGACRNDKDKWRKNDTTLWPPPSSMSVVRVWMLSKRNEMHPKNAWHDVCLLAPDGSRCGCLFDGIHTRKCCLWRMLRSRDRSQRCVPCSRTCKQHHHPERESDGGSWRFDACAVAMVLMMFLFVKQVQKMLSYQNTLEKNTFCILTN